TRAADRLVIVRARKRNMRNTSPSEFFSTLPDEVEHRSQSDLEQQRTALPRVSVPPDPRVAADRELRRRLCVMRDVIARTNYTMPEAVLSDSLVARIVREKPRDMEHLSRILGPLTAVRLGAAILREIGPVE
ncbi:MAG: HRDC domain-containing protein, partial [Acidimicrobiia bacterium]